MSGYLLDTNVALFAVANSARLSHGVRSAIITGPNLISAASYWEVFIKSMKGNLNVGDPRIWWAQALRQLSAIPLPILPEHVDRLYNLPSIHKDPFDRVLIAQATAESLTLVTTDSQIPLYASQSFQVVI